MQVTYQLTAEDYRHALITFRDRSFFSRWMVLFTAVVLALAIAIQLTSKEDWMRSSLPITIAGIVLLAFAHWGAPYLNARRQFRSTPSAHEQITLEVQDAGLHFRSLGIDSSAAWNHYIKWIEDDQVFALFRSSLIFVIVPKRAFSADQLISFKGILRQKILASADQQTKLKV